MKLYHELTTFYGSKRKDPLIIQGWQGMRESEKGLHSKGNNLVPNYN
jgi:hypothetical protein